MFPFPIFYSISPLVFFMGSWVKEDILSPFIIDWNAKGNFNALAFKFIFRAIIHSDGFNINNNCLSYSGGGAIS